MYTAEKPEKQTERKTEKQTDKDTDKNNQTDRAKTTCPDLSIAILENNYLLRNISIYFSIHRYFHVA